MSGQNTGHVTIRHGTGAVPVDLQVYEPYRSTSCGRREHGMPRTGFVYAEVFQWHDTGNYAGFMPYGFPIQPGEHFENPETKRRMKTVAMPTS